MIQQLNPPIPVETPQGAAYAHMVIDYSQEHYLLFVCFLQTTGECWIYPNRDVKLQRNLSMGVRMSVPRPIPEPCQCEADHPLPSRNGIPMFNGTS